MNEPIVSPLFIYLLGVVEGIGIISGIAVTIFGGTYLGFKIAAWSSLIEYGDKDKDYQRCRSIYRKTLLPFLIFLFVSVFVPSKTTLLQMYAANYITFERVEKAVKLGKSLKDEIKSDIIDIILAIDSDGEENK